MDTSSIKFGPGMINELGFEMTRLNCRRVLLVTDPNIVKLPVIEKALDSLRSKNIETTVFDQVQIEPSDSSLKEAIKFGESGKFDGYIAVGGGSTIDTAKVINLYTSYPADFLTYVNAPIGRGKSVPGQLKPLIAIPTTSGTGSETTGVAIFDLLDMNAKTGIADRSLRPTVGIIDPENLSTLPPMVTACSGFDVLCHGLESYTAMPYFERERPLIPDFRPIYQGSNPISDIWALNAITLVAKNLVRAVNDRSDLEAKTNMMLAATFAGIGFGNAGVHLCHGMSYPVSGNVKDFVADSYPKNKPLIPHGMSVILNAPAVFRWTSQANRKRHMTAARILGAKHSTDNNEVPGELLSKALINLMRQTNMPNGLQSVGYLPEDIDDLVNGTMPQHRVTKISPRPINSTVLRNLFLDSMTLW